MAENKETKNVTGLEDVKPANKKAEEFNLLANLLDAANFKNDEGEIKEVEIRRNGRYMFTVHVHPIGEEESQKAHRKATKKKKNRRGQFVATDEVDSKLKNSWLIYYATTEKDQKEIWGNPEFMEKLDLIEPVESIDLLLKVGEKIQLIDTIFEISGWAEDEDDEEILSDEEYVKN